MRSRSSLAALVDARLAGLVHESVADDPAQRHRHERFLVSRLATGAVMMAALPPYLVWRGVPTGVEALAAASLFMPILAAVLLARTGRFWVAHAVSSFGLAGLAVCLAALTGGVRSPAAIWLVAVPLEALVSGSRRATISAALIAVAGVAAIAGADLWIGPSPIVAISAGIAMPVFALTAIGHVAAQALEHLRDVGRWEARLRDNEARDRMLLAAIDDLVTWHDPNGRVIEASASAGRFLACEPETLRGHGLLERVHVTDRPALLQALSDVAATGRPATLAFRLRAGGWPGDGGLMHAEMRAHRLERSADAPAGVVAVTRDVSGHHRHAAELDRARAEAERADEAKSRFLANVTHELRTPLNAIIGFSQVLAGEDALVLSPAQAREYAGIIGASGQHLLEVVDTLLDMSRIQSGNFDYAPETVDAAALVRAACDLMRPRANAADLRLVQSVPETLEAVADPRAFRQVLINLIANAVKFTPAGGRVELALRRGRDGLVLTVADTGAGVAQADLPRLGTPFFQGGAGGYRRSHEGAGLGLSVVQGLVGLHGGRILIESAPGAGTAVTVTLPHEARRPEAACGPAPLATAVRRTDGPGPVVRLPLGLFETAPTSVRESSTDPVPLRRAG